MNNRPTVKLYMDTRRQKVSGLYPVKLRIYHLRKYYYISLETNLSKQDFEDILNQKAKRNLALEGEEINAKLVRAKEVINGMRAFSFEEFKKRFGINSPLQNVAWYFEHYVEVLRSKRQYGSAESYKSTFNMMREFYQENFRFELLTVTALDMFEIYLLDKGRSISTVGTHMRNLRRIFNVAIKDKAITRDDYPFGRDEYVIPQTRKRKRSIPKELVKSIMDYQCVSDSQMFYRDLWSLSYFAGGMNMHDIAYLKHKDLQGHNLEYVRKKTERSTRSNSKTIQLYLANSAIEIIEKWKNDPSESTFLLPIITEGDSEEKQRKDFKQVNAMVSEKVSKIAEELGIPFRVTYQTARHSFANALRNGGVDLNDVQEVLGHSSPEVTKLYLDDLDNRKLEQFANIIDPNHI